MLLVLQRAAEQTLLATCSWLKSRKTLPIDFRDVMVGKRRLTPLKPYSSRRSNAGRGLGEAEADLAEFISRTPVQSHRRVPPSWISWTLFSTAEPAACFWKSGVCLQMPLHFTQGVSLQMPLHFTDPTTSNRRIGGEFTSLSIACCVTLIRFASGCPFS